MNELIYDHLRSLEKLLRKAENDVEYAVSGFERRQTIKKRNAINAACNALHRASKA
jgi:hypothetical protein